MTPKPASRLPNGMKNPRYAAWYRETNAEKIRAHKSRQNVIKRGFDPATRFLTSVAVACDQWLSRRGAMESSPGIPANSHANNL